MAIGVIPTWKEKGSVNSAVKAAVGHPRFSCLHLDHPLDGGETGRLLTSPGQFLGRTQSSQKHFVSLSLPQCTHGAVQNYQRLDGLTNKFILSKF